MFKELDPLLHSELRLAIISILAGVESADFTYMKGVTNSTAGNLSVQIDKLEKAGYITVKKGYNARKPQTTCSLTERGRDALAAYVEALKSFLPDL